MYDDYDDIDDYLDDLTDEMEDDYLDDDFDFEEEMIEDNYQMQVDEIDEYWRSVPFQYRRHAHPWLSLRRADAETS
jgi:hypothetical protein